MIVFTRKYIKEITPGAMGCHRRRDAGAKLLGLIMVITGICVLFAVIHLYYQLETEESNKNKAPAADVAPEAAAAEAVTPVPQSQVSTRASTPVPDTFVNVSSRRASSAIEGGASVNPVTA